MQCYGNRMAVLLTLLGVCDGCWPLKVIGWSDFPPHSVSCLQPEKDLKWNIWKAVMYVDLCVYQILYINMYICALSVLGQSDMYG